MAKNKKENPESKGGLKEFIKKHREIITYIIVGGLTTLVRWGTTFMFVSALAPIGFTSDSFFTTLFSLIITILFAFVPNKLYVFESKSFDKSIVAKEFVSFIIARAAASLFELFVIPLLTWLTGWHVIIPTILVSVVVLIVNYLLSKLVIFKKRVPVQEEALTEKQAKKEQKSRNRKDKLLGGVCTVVCAVIAIASIVSCAINGWNMFMGLFSSDNNAPDTQVVTTVPEVESTPTATTIAE